MYNCIMCKSDRITTLNSCWFQRLLDFNPEIRTNDQI